MITIIEYGYNLEARLAYAAALLIFMGVLFLICYFYDYLCEAKQDKSENENTVDNV